MRKNNVSWNMKKLAYIIIAALLIALGWFIRGWTANTMLIAAKTDQSSVASDVLKGHIFDTAYAEVTLTQDVIEFLSSGRIEDAMVMLRTRQDGSIFALEDSIDPAAISPEQMTALRDLQASIQSSHGSPRQVADRALARVATYRANHPWTYKGNLPHPTNAEAAEAEAKLASILKRASESQK